jgi:parallel beta-helix repeat protein
MWDAVGNCTGTGGSVCWEKGMFPLTGNHTMTQNNVTLYGQGASSILYLNGNYTNPIKIDGNDTTILNLAFDGNYKNTLESVPQSGDCLWFETGTRALVQNCRFYGWMSHAIVSGVGNTADKITVYGCDFRNCSWWECAFAGGNFNTIIGCTLENVYGLELASNYNTATGNRIISPNTGLTTPSYKGFIVNGIGNIVENNFVYQMMISVEGNNNSITNNVVDSCVKGYSAGIITITNDNTITLNRINHCSGTEMSGIGVYWGSRNFVANNKISDCPRGLYVYDSTSYNNTFQSNYLTECTIMSVNNGNNTMFNGNYFGGLPCINSGSKTSCVNGTWIAHGLAGQPNGACELKVNGSRLINATCYIIDPVIIAENRTHVQVEFLCNNAGTFNPVGTAEAKTILWSFEYKP